VSALLQLTNVNRSFGGYGSQLALLIVPTTQPEEIEQYSIRVVEKWKLGRRKVDDGALLDRVEATNRAEVNEPERAVGEHEHVPRMWIRVEEADSQHLIEHAAQQLVGEGRLVDLRGGELSRVGHGEAFEALLDDEASRAQVPVHLRNPNLGVVTEREGHLGHGVDLATKVELGAQTLRELFQELSGSKTLP